MPIRTIATPAELATWLEEQWDLNDAFVTTLDPLPPESGSGAAPPAEVRIELWMQVAGTYRAGEERTVREMALRAVGLSRYEIGRGTDFISGSCSQGMEMLDEGGLVAFGMEVPGPVRVACERLEVLRVEDRVEMTPRWLSEREVWVDVPDARFPAPAEWVDAMRAAGIDAAWRYHAGPATPPERVPADPTGWLLQHRDRIETDPLGLFFWGVWQRNDGFRIKLERMGDRGLFIAAGRFLATFADARFSSGNDELGAGEWLAHLEAMEREHSPAGTGPAEPVWKDGRPSAERTPTKP